MATSTDIGGRLVVRFDRKWGLAGGVLFIVILAPIFVRAAASGRIGTTLILLGPLSMGCWLFWSGIHTRATLIIDSRGLTFCQAHMRLPWSEIAAIELQEWQRAYGLAHRLWIRTVHPERLGAMWAGAPRRPWVQHPRDGRLALPLDLLSPRPQEIAKAIQDYSGGTFAPEVRRVRSRPFREPESARTRPARNCGRVGGRRPSCGHDAARSKTVADAVQQYWRRGECGGRFPCCDG